MMMSLGFFTSCEDEDDPVKPTITVVETPNASYEKASTVTYTITLGSNEKLTKFVVDADPNGGTATVLTPETPNLFEEDGETIDISTTSEVLVYTYIVPEQPVGTTVTVTFTVTDKETTNEVVMTFDIVEGGTNPTETAFGEEKTASIWNKLGSQSGAYDLNTDANVASSETADMQNPTDLTSKVDNNFFAGWTSETTTRFVKANDFDYATGTVEAAITAYAGTKLETVGANYDTDEANAVKINDIYVAKIRDTDEYALIKVTAVNVTADDNDDKITFSYKKGEVVATTTK